MYISDETQFDSQRKLGDDELISSFRQKLESSIQEKFESIVQANDDRRVFIVSTTITEKLRSFASNPHELLITTVFLINWK